MDEGKRPLFVKFNQKPQGVIMIEDEGDLDDVDEGEDYGEPSETDPEECEPNDPWWWMTEKQYSCLSDLAKTGAWPPTVEDIVQSLVAQEIRRATDEGWL